MQAYNFIFDATQYDPQQSAPIHPVGNFVAEVVNTDIKPTKDGISGFFEVSFRTDAGRIVNRYNLWNANETAARTAHNQLSALGYVTGVLSLDMGQKGVELRGARCIIEVTKQANSEYTQVSRVMDMNGNEPMAQGVRRDGQLFQPQQANHAHLGQPAAWNGAEQGQPAASWNGPGAGQSQPAPVAAQVWSKPAGAPAQAPGQASALTQGPGQGAPTPPWQAPASAPTPNASNAPPWART